MSTDPLSISHQQKDGIAVIYLDGKFIGENVSLVEKFVEDIKQNPKVKNFLFNFSKVFIIDSNGIGYLVRLFNLLKANGGKMGLCNLNSTVSQVMQISRLDNVLMICQSETEALVKMK